MIVVPAAVVMSIAPLMLFERASMPLNVAAVMLPPVLMTVFAPPACARVKMPDWPDVIAAPGPVVTLTMPLDGPVPVTSASMPLPVAVMAAFDTTVTLPVPVSSARMPVPPLATTVPLLVTAIESVGAVEAFVAWMPIVPAVIALPELIVSVPPVPLIAATMPRWVAPMVVPAAVVMPMLPLVLFDSASMPLPLVAVRLPPVPIVVPALPACARV